MVCKGGWGWKGGWDSELGREEVSEESKRFGGTEQVDYLRGRRRGFRAWIGVLKEEDLHAAVLLGRGGERRSATKFA